MDNDKYLRLDLLRIAKEIVEVNAGMDPNMAGYTAGDVLAVAAKLNDFIIAPEGAAIALQPICK